MDQDYQPTELEELQDLYCDLHKSVYGVKARWYQPTSVEQARRDLENLQRAGETVWAEEERARELARDSLVRQLTEIVQSGARDIDTAIRWLRDSLELADSCDSYLEFRLGVSYGTIAALRAQFQNLPQQS